MSRIGGHMNFDEFERCRRVAASHLAGLCVIIDPNLTGGRDPLWIVEQAITGGATAIQVRDKSGDGTLGLVNKVAMVCGDVATVIVNDFPDIARLAEVGGVHLGQQDHPIQEARSLLHQWQIIGTSNALEEEVSLSVARGADYIAIGRMYPTNSKADTRLVGPEGLRILRACIPMGGPPIVAIGGINISNVLEVAEAGADGICVIGAVSLARDPRAAATELIEAFRAGKS
jgi:thiamine-phosphate pyrophosphorylase